MTVHELLISLDVAGISFSDLPDCSVILFPFLHFFFIFLSSLSWQTYISAPFCFAGILVRYRGTGDHQTETETGCGVALEAPGVLHPNGRSAPEGGPPVRAPWLLQDHDRQGFGQRERTEFPGHKGMALSF